MPCKKISYTVVSRNDSYCGDSVGRLETTLNHTGEILASHSRMEESEIVLCDWCSPESNGPLSSVLNLNKETRSILKIVEVPAVIANKYQKDSPFSEVHAMNVAFRHSVGKFFARLDQDTLIGHRFVRWFYEEFHETPLNWPLVAFSGRRNLSKDQSKEYKHWILDEERSREVEICHPHAFYSRIMPHRKRLFSFYGAAVGIMIVERELYLREKGFNEDLIYMNNMDTEFLNRLSRRTRFVNLSLRSDADFYHLHHTRAGGAINDTTQPHIDANGCRRTNSNEFRKGIPNENPEDWGLNSEALVVKTFQDEIFCNR